MKSHNAGVDAAREGEGDKLSKETMTSAERRPSDP